MRDCLKAVIQVFAYEITIDNSSNPNELTDYQILLSIENDPTFFEDCEGNQTFLEFYDEDQETLLSHYVEEWDTTNNNAKIWIKIPQIPASSTKKIYLKINKARTEDLSNPEQTFDFFDDFSGDLSKWIGNLDIPQAINFAVQICNGMAYAYDKLRLVHRDLKPRNILITGGKIAKITDFGLVKVFDDAYTSETSPDAKERLEKELQKYEPSVSKPVKWIREKIGRPKEGPLEILEKDVNKLSEDIKELNQFFEEKVEGDLTHLQRVNDEDKPQYILSLIHI